MSAAWEQVADEIMRRLAGIAATRGMTQPVTVVDCGCGQGETAMRIATTLADQRLRFLGVASTEKDRDIARETAKLRKLDGACRFERGDVATLPLPTPIDLAYFHGTFFRALEPSALLVRLGPLLAPGGAIVVCEEFPPDTPLRSWADGAGLHVDESVALRHNGSTRCVMLSAR